MYGKNYFKVTPVSLTLSSITLLDIPAPFTTNTNSNSGPLVSLDEPVLVRTIRRTTGGTFSNGPTSIKIHYSDGTTHEANAQPRTITNPYPDKLISGVKMTRGYNSAELQDLVFYRNDISNELSLPVGELGYHPRNVWLSVNESNLSLGDADRLEISLVGTTGSVLLKIGAKTVIPENIGGLTNYSLKIFPEPEYVGDLLPSVSSFQVRFE
jgi:hypothetical protein